MTQVQITCHSIKWDIDAEDESEDLNLPENVVLVCDEEVVSDECAGDLIGDLLSDKTGWCHTGFQYSVEKIPN